MFKPKGFKKENLKNKKEEKGESKATQKKEMKFGEPLSKKSKSIIKKGLKK